MSEKKLEKNYYINVYSIKKNIYYPVRIIETLDKNHKLLNLSNGEIFITDYVYNKMYKRIFIDREVLKKLKFKKEYDYTKFKDFTFFKVTFIEQKSNDEYILIEHIKTECYLINSNELHQVENLNDTEFKKYIEKKNELFDINILLNELMDKYPDEFNYEYFDKILKKK